MTKDSNDSHFLSNNHFLCVTLCKLVLISISKFYLIMQLLWHRLWSNIISLNMASCLCAHFDTIMILTILVGESHTNNRIHNFIWWLLYTDQSNSDLVYSVSLVTQHVQNKITQCQLKDASIPLQINSCVHRTWAIIDPLKFRETQTSNNLEWKEAPSTSTNRPSEDFTINNTLTTSDWGSISAQPLHSNHKNVPPSSRTFWFGSLNKHSRSDEMITVSP